MITKENIKEAKKALAILEKQLKNPTPQVTTRVATGGTGSGYSRILYSEAWNGERNFGEIGPVKSYLPDYNTLRARSWQAYLESELAQLTISRWITWVIGDGLRLQSEPQKKVLKMFGIEVDTNEFSEKVEALYSIYAEARQADHSNMMTKNELSAEALKHSIVGGDVLVVLRFENDRPTIQLIDGELVCTPHTYIGNEFYTPPLPNGNRIENGVELSPTNEHVAYWVKKPGLPPQIDYERIVARGANTGLLMAFLVYGNRYRINNHRGLPLLSVMLESIKKLERYKEATVGGAEERSKIAYFFEHGIESTGENPLAAGIAKLMNATNNEVPIDDVGNALADKVYASTNKQTFNLPIGVTLKAVEGKSELYFKDFYTININILCAVIGIPPNVALMVYDQSYSASRAAIKDWEHSLKVARKKHANQFEMPVYSFWLHIAILANIVQAVGFMAAYLGNQWMIVQAYLKARFQGPNVPHIDPEKEVNAVRLKLGETGAAIPLTTVEAATEELDGGGSDENMEQYADELAESKKLGIELPEPPAPAGPVGGKKLPKKPAPKGK